MPTRKSWEMTDHYRKIGRKGVKKARKALDEPKLAFVARIDLRNDGTDNMKDRLEEVVRNATISEFGNKETISVSIERLYR